MSSQRALEFLLKVVRETLEAFVPPAERDVFIAQFCAKLHEDRSRRTSSLAFKPPEKKT